MGIPTDCTGGPLLSMPAMRPMGNPHHRNKPTKVLSSHRSRTCVALQHTLASFMTRFVCRTQMAAKQTCGRAAGVLGGGVISSSAPASPLTSSPAAGAHSATAEAAVRSARLAGAGAGMCAAAGGACVRVASSCVVDPCNRLSVCGPLLSWRPKPVASIGFCHT